MAVSPTFIVSLVALATLCGGALEGLPNAGAGTGIARSLPWDVDVAFVETSLDAETDDGDDCPQDREWHACGRADAAALPAGGGHCVVVRPYPVAASRGHATRSIRGPPARG